MLYDFSSFFFLQLNRGPLDGDSRILDKNRWKHRRTHEQLEKTPA